MVSSLDYFLCIGAWRSLGQLDLSLQGVVGTQRPLAPLLGAGNPVTDTE